MTRDDPDGIRTRVAALKGPCPRPLDDGAGHPGCLPGWGTIRNRRGAGKGPARSTLRVRRWAFRLPEMRTSNVQRPSLNVERSLTRRPPPCLCAFVLPCLSSRAMLHYFKFRQELFAPRPAKEVYVKRGAGKGWPEECPPVRAANGFGFDLLANFDVTFVRRRGGGWRAEP